MYQDNPTCLFDFTNEKTISGWTVVDDRVMGGLSMGGIAINNSGNGQFTGFVTPENNGGFSSVRYKIDQKDVSQFSHVNLRIKGDGKSYQFRIKGDASQRHSYIHSFKTSGAWETIKLSLDEFYPAFRGQKLDIPNYPGERMEEIALLIGNKQEESFSLEIEKIWLE